ncbi:hypothetical protein [Flavobacterium sp. GP15]|uniref:hypothetical protein n=1 Tax=Flavobacterium sp. GP15 TaxID=2758567 RepID=UPI00165E1B4E|nr:hypothetical protein [Flavobacterium sp. GP15]
MKNEFENLTKTSITSLIESGIVKSVTVEQLNENNRLIATLTGKNSTYAEILIGKESSKIILKSGGLSERMLSESSLVLIDGELGKNLRFTTTEYSDVGKVLGIEEVKSKKIKNFEAKQLLSITEILESYWRD